jgi:uncharacterized protein (TIGR03118 family)
MLKSLFGPSGVKPARRLRLEQLETRTVPATAFFQTNLISDVPGMAEITDPNLKNPWGVAVNPTGDFWVSDAATGTVTLYGGDVNGSAIHQDSPIITIPAATGQTTGSPSGQVFNSTSDFPVNGTPASFIIAGLDGTISAVAPNPKTGAFPSNATLKVTTPGAVYTGITIGSNASGNFVFAANSAAGTIDVFNKSFQKVKLSGNFIDPNLPANFVPFNVVNINGVLFVTYENSQDHFFGGLVDRFDTNGNFLGRFASGSNLNAPWAVTLAPAGFGAYGGDLLIGDFGDGRINVYDPTSGLFLGQLMGQNGQPVAIERLWQLTFGNDATAGTLDTLYFSSGLNSEKDGLFGSLTPLTLNQQFVAQIYNDLLQRPADATGLAYWTNLLNLGATRQQIVQGIESSTEYMNLEVSGLYTQLLHRGVDPQGLNYWTSILATGATVEEVAEGIAKSPEFYQLNGGTISGFVNGLYEDALGRAPDATGDAFFINELKADTPRVQVAAAFFTGTEFLSDSVNNYYVSYLHRPADANGLAFFVNALQLGATDQQVIAVILSSAEFLSDL